MSLSLRERLTQTLMPAALYYRSRIADEATWGEHELDVLPKIMAPGGTAIDAEANQGVFAYAFSRIAACPRWAVITIGATIRRGCLFVALTDVSRHRTIRAVAPQQANIALTS